MDANIKLTNTIQRLQVSSRVIETGGVCYEYTYQYVYFLVYYYSFYYILLKLYLEHDLLLEFNHRQALHVKYIFLFPYLASCV